MWVLNFNTLSLSCLTNDESMHVMLCRILNWHKNARCMLYVVLHPSFPRFHVKVMNLCFYYKFPLCCHVNKILIFLVIWENWKISSISPTRYTPSSSHQLSKAFFFSFNCFLSFFFFDKSCKKDLS